MALRLLVTCMILAVALGKIETDLNKAKGSSNFLNINNRCPPGHLSIPKLLPHEEDCSLFYNCQNGQAILQKCPSKLNFNPSKSICDFPENTDCKKGHTTLKPKGRINDQHNFVICPKTPLHLLIPHPTDCGKFFTCDAGVAHLTTCQKGLHFNEELQTCDYPENADCLSDFTKVPREQIDGRIPNALCPSEKTKHPILKPHESDCGKFYICDGATPHLKVCQSGLHFNQKTQTCDYPRNAECDSSIVTEKPQEKTGDEVSYLQCPAVNVGNPVLLPHQTDCGKFYICDSGVAHLKICQSGLHFNPRVQACDYPRNAGCTKDLSKKDPSSKGRLGNFELCPTRQNGDMVLVPDPENCSKFFMCDSGITHAQKCPSGLHFSTALQACDYPENVKCEKMGRLLSVGEPSPFCPTINGKTPVFYRHPTNCSVYFMCSNGLAYKFVCPARLHFNLRQKICDYEWSARCPTGKPNDNEES